MKSISSKIIYFAIPGLLLIGAMILAGSTHDTTSEELKHVSEHATMVSLNPPDGLNFAGEFVPIWDFDIRERFDNQLIRNVFFHSSTIMTMKRAARWQNEIVGILRKQGIPEDFFYLCVAESHLENVTSPAGAKGFWQFMKGTADQYNLKVTSEIDERLDPLKSTTAACRYIKEAYKKFGDWTLVAASYNMGMQGISNALERQKVDSYYDLYLNQETSAYVYRIIALKSVMQEPEKYGFTLSESDLYKPLRYKAVRITESIPDLVVFAREQGTTYKMLKVMNPWLLSDKLSVADKESYLIKIPVGGSQNAGELEEKTVNADSLAKAGKAVSDSSDTDSIQDSSKLNPKKDK
ncbi:MAG: transglycosylase SLT domain-containing protein [Bacteroidia bacterium]|nr:transglycosylase SLT domain-containing protein [Bacteroidia bacterium]